MSEYKRNYEEVMNKLREEKMAQGKSAHEKKNLRNYSQFSLSGEEHINQYYEQPKTETDLQ